MIYSASELSRLARTYCEHRDLTLAGLGERVFGNHKFFKLLEAGKGAHSRKLEEASVWFLDNWPPDAPWPSDIERPRPTSEAA